MSRSREVPAQEMKTVPISQFRRDCVDLLEAASRAGAPLVVTRRGKPVARVLPFPGANAQLEPAGEVLKDRMEFAGDGTSPVEASWYGMR
jgi:prevent-host-death family protein